MYNSFVKWRLRNNDNDSDMYTTIKTIRPEISYKLIIFSNQRDAWYVTSKPSIIAKWCSCALSTVKLIKILPASIPLSKIVIPSKHTIPHKSNFKAVVIHWTEFCQDQYYATYHRHHSRGDRQASYKIWPSRNGLWRWGGTFIDMWSIQHTGIARISGIKIYRKTSCISRTKFQSLNVSCTLLQLPSLNPLKPGVKLRMKM